MEAEGGIEPPYTALQAVNLRLFFNLISGLHRESGNPLLKPTLRRQMSFSHVSVLNSTMRTARSRTSGENVLFTFIEEKGRSGTI